MLIVRLLFFTLSFRKPTQLWSYFGAEDSCAITQKQHKAEFLLLCAVELQSVSKSKIVRGNGSVMISVLIFRGRISANINYCSWGETSFN